MPFLCCFSRDIFRISRWNLQVGFRMSEYHLCPTTTWKVQIVHREVPGQPNVVTRVLEERIGENVGKILGGS